MARILERTLIQDLVANKGTLISTPKHTIIQEVLRMLVENEITAILITSYAEQQTLTRESSPVQTSAHYIGIVSMLDIALHIGTKLHHAETALEAPVSNLIGQTNDSRLLWTINPNTKLYDAMIYLCKGVHRFLVPGHGHDHPETASFRLLTQTDVVSFLVMHVNELGPCVSRTVSELGLLHPDLLALAVPSNMSLYNALRLMHQKHGFSSLPVVEPGEDDGDDHSDTAHPTWVRGGKLIGSLSANCLCGLDFEEIKSLKPEMSVAGFLNKASSMPLVTVRPTTPLATVMEAAITNKVHKVWVTNEDDWLLGDISFSDIIGAVRREPTSFIQR